MFSRGESPLIADFDERVESLQLGGCLWPGRLISR